MNCFHSSAFVGRLAIRCAPYLHCQNLAGMHGNLIGSLCARLIFLYSIVTTTCKRSVPCIWLTVPYFPPKFHVFPLARVSCLIWSAHQWITDMCRDRQQMTRCVYRHVNLSALFGISEIYAGARLAFSVG